MRYTSVDMSYLILWYWVVCSEWIFCYDAFREDCASDWWIVFVIVVIDIIDVVLYVMFVCVIVGLNE